MTRGHFKAISKPFKITLSYLKSLKKSNTYKSTFDFEIINNNFGILEGGTRGRLVGQTRTKQTGLLQSQATLKTLTGLVKSPTLKGRVQNPCNFLTSYGNPG